MTESKEIQCSTFRHQVGGHKCILQITDKLIGKPCEQPERDFYRNVPELLKPYVPQYRGEVNIRCQTYGSKNTLHATVPLSMISSNESCDSNDSSDEEDWSKSRLSHQLNSGSMWNQTDTETFLVLDNLLQSFDKPCALDMKIGRFYHGLCADQQKKELLERKSNSSTSSTLGFRLGGMQLYNPESGKFQKYNKHFGMTLNDRQVIGILKNFLERLTNDELKNISESIRNIHNAIRLQPEYVFLAASLFIFYDNRPEEVDTKSEVKGKCDVSCRSSVRLIDMEKAVLTTDTILNSVPQHIQDNLHFGMTNLANTIDNIREYRTL